jgi:hypothetical protein
MKSKQQLSITTPQLTEKAGSNGYKQERQPAKLWNF